MGKDNLPKTGGLFLMKRGANGEIAGRNSMDKRENEMIVELKKTLNRIYDRFEQRMDRHCWKNAVKDATEKAPDEALKTAAEFIMKHPHIPASCVRSAFFAADLSKQAGDAFRIVFGSCRPRSDKEDDGRGSCQISSDPAGSAGERAGRVYRCGQSSGISSEKGTGLSGGRKGGGSRYFSGDIPTCLFFRRKSRVCATITTERNVFCSPCFPRSRLTPGLMNWRGISMRRGRIIPRLVPLI